MECRFLWAECPSSHPTNEVKTLKPTQINQSINQSLTYESRDTAQFMPCHRQYTVYVLNTHV